MPAEKSQKGGCMMAFKGNMDTFQISVGTESATEKWQSLNVEEKILD